MYDNRHAAYSSLSQSYKRTYRRTLKSICTVIHDVNWTRFQQIAIGMTKKSHRQRNIAAVYCANTSSSSSSLSSLTAAPAYHNCWKFESIAINACVSPPSWDVENVEEISSYDVTLRERGQVARSQCIRFVYSRRPVVHGSARYASNIIMK